MQRSWESERNRFHSLSQLDQMGWLSHAMVLISICARGTYVAGTDRVSDPKRLRRFNELMHRLAGAASHLAWNDDQRIPVPDLFLSLQHSLRELGVADEDFLDHLR